MRDGGECDFDRDLGGISSSNADETLNFEPDEMHGGCHGWICTCCGIEDRRQHVGC
jgi:hypothetical protein